VRVTRDFFDRLPGLLAMSLLMFSRSLRISEASIWMSEALPRMPVEG